MNIDAIISKLEEIEASISEIKAQLNQEIKPYRLAFVNFFAGGKSYAYTADEDIAEGDIVYVPTSSRGNIAGVVVFTERYNEAELPFRDTKKVIGKLENIENLTTTEVVQMMNELSPAISAREDSKSRLCAFLARRSTNAVASMPVDDNVANEDMHCTCSDHCSCNGNTTTSDVASVSSSVTPIDDDAWDEGDIDNAISSNEPETTLTDSSSQELPY